MKFLDPKEQVLELQLTQHGKRLLSQGAFKPVYYGFYDDDVLYDSSYASTSETQNDAQPRIQENTPRLGVQANYSSAERERFLRRSPVQKSWWEKFNKSKRGTKLGGASMEPIRYIKQEPDKNQPLRFSLGTSTPFNDKLPAWSVAFLSGELSGSTYHYTDAESELHFIPQVDARIRYNVKIKKVSGEDEFASQLDAQVYQDGTYIDVEDDFLLIRLKEANVTFSRENYDLEVYEVLNDGAELLPLELPTEKSSWDEFFALDAPGSDNVATDSAEYYMDLSVDEEIDPSLLADMISEKLGNMYLDKELRRTQNRTTFDNTRRDIYKSVVDPTEHCEE